VTPPLAVVVAGKEGLVPAALARAVAGFRKVTIPDGAMAVRKARGILAEDLDGAGAEDLVARLAAEGIAAKAVPASLLAPPPPPLILSRAEATPSVFVAEMKGETLRVPWGRIRLVAVAPFTTTVYGKVKTEDIASGREMAMQAGVMAFTGVPLSLGKKKTAERAVPKSEFHLLLDLLLEGPVERLRVDAGRFDFSGLGKRMAYAPHVNLRLLLESIVAAAPTAATSPGADLLLTGGRLASLGYASVDDFEREMRWLAAVSP
jgi:hypothetical protein